MYNFVIFKTKLLRKIIFYDRCKEDIGITR